MTFERAAGFAAALLVAGGVIAGFAVIGSPGHARELELDHRRILDVLEISKAIRARYGRGYRSEPLPTALPANVRALRDDGSDATRDPATGRPYEYARLGADAYRLCVRFAQPASETEPGYASWRHPAGRVCYRLDTAQEMRWLELAPPTVS